MVRLASVFLVTCNTYVLATSIVVTVARLTLAVGSLVSLLARSCYTKQVVIYHHRQGLKPGDISRKLQQEGIKATRRGIAKFLAKFIKSGSVARKTGSGRPSKRNGPCNGTDRATEWNGPFYAVIRKMLSPCNTNGPERF